MPTFHAPRKVAEIEREIVAELGFFPPFFAPVRSDAAILESLWHQTVFAYLSSRD